MCMYIHWLVVTVLSKRLHILLLGCLLAACTSVSQKDRIVYTDFPKEQSLQASPLPLDTAVFRYPFRVRIVGNRAAVLDLHGPDHFVQVFSYPDFLPFDGCAFRMCTADGEIQMRRMFTLCSALSGRSTERNPLECRNGAGKDC